MKINQIAADSDIRVELIPLIDVIFCILTFFILAALQFTRQQAINVTLPKARTGQPQVRQLMLVSVDLIGQTYVDRKPVTREELTKELQRFLKQTPTGVVVLNAAKTASYNDVIQVLDLLRSAGGDRVALATLPAASNQSPGSDTLPAGTTVPGWTVPGRPGAAGSGQIPPTLPNLPSQSGTNPLPNGSNSFEGPPTMPTPPAPPQ